MAGLAQRRAARRAEEDPGALPSTVDAADGLSRRRFLGYLLAAPTIVAGAELFLAEPASASLPTVQPVDAYDLTDLLTDATLATSNLITVVVNTDGTVSFALPRAEVGQGITTAVAMTIADEIGLPLDKVNITLANARPGARVEPAHRRFEFDALDLHAGEDCGRDRPRPARAHRREDARPPGGRDDGQGRGRDRP